MIKIIHYISEKCNNVVFVLWGRHAYNKINLIDHDKYDVIISSHPSGLSVNKSMKEYPAFCNCDHFGLINKFLIEKGKEKVIWQI